MSRLNGIAALLPLLRMRMRMVRSCLGKQMSESTALGLPCGATDNSPPWCANRLFQKEPYQDLSLTFGKPCGQQPNRRFGVN